MLTQDVLDAAAEWSAARSALNTLHITDPEFSAAINRLAEAEHRLQQAVRRLLAEAAAQSD